MKKISTNKTFCGEIISFLIKYKLLHGPNFKFNTYMMLIGVQFLGTCTLCDGLSNRRKWNWLTKKLESCKWHKFSHKYILFKIQSSMKTVNLYLFIGINFRYHVNVLKKIEHKPWHFPIYIIQYEGKSFSCQWDRKSFYAFFTFLNMFS